ncbi:MAG: serine/threonine transporter SstT, partial [Fusicatenibacter saccharivorans]
MKKLIQKWNSINLIKRIICGLIVGIILGLAIPQASVISILGDLFVGALRGIAPLL